MRPLWTGGGCASKDEGSMIVSAGETALDGDEAIAVE